MKQPSPFQRFALFLSHATLGFLSDVGHSVGRVFGNVRDQALDAVRPDEPGEMLIGQAYEPQPALEAPTTGEAQLDGLIAMLWPALPRSMQRALPELMPTVLLAFQQFGNLSTISKIHDERARLRAEIASLEQALKTAAPHIAGDWRETAATLEEKLKNMALTLLATHLPGIADGHEPPEPTAAASPTPATAPVPPATASSEAAAAEAPAAAPADLSTAQERVTAVEIPTPAGDTIPAPAGDAPVAEAPAAT